MATAHLPVTVVLTLWITICIVLGFESNYYHIFNHRQIKHVSQLMNNVGRIECASHCMTRSRDGPVTFAGYDTETRTCFLSADNVTFIDNMNTLVISPKQAVECIIHEHPTNGSATVNGSSVMFTCDPGYAIVGESIILCNVDGGLMGPAPTCQPHHPTSVTGPVQNNTASERPFLQTCFNCDTASNTNSYPHVSYPNEESDLCRAGFENTSLCGSAAFELNAGKCTHSTYTDVEFSLGYIAFRYSTSTDCPVFTIEQMMNKVGTCSVIETDATVPVALPYCVNRCLDMDNCRAVTYLQPYCTYHVCETSDDHTYFTYNRSPGDFVFVKRICNTTGVCERPYFQVCHDCRTRTCFGSQTYIGTFTSMCNSSFAADEHWLTAQYKPRIGQCTLTGCATVTPSNGRTVYRRSCTNDCPIYRLETKIGVTASCPPYDNYFGDKLKLSFCIEKCLDTDGCRGITHVQNMCLYHNCSTEGDIGLSALLNTTAVTDGDSGSSTSVITFVKRICDVCVKKYGQLCVNCGSGPNCQKASQVAPAALFNNQIQLCYTSDWCHTVYRDMTGGACKSNECSEVTLKQGSITYRKSCTQDCNMYALTVLTGYTGNMSCVIGQPIPNQPLYEDCLEICLDTPDCRAITHDSTSYLYESGNYCYLHSCRGTVNATSTFTHVDRECDVTKIDCGVPVISNASDVIFNTTNYESTAEVTCPHGYELIIHGSMQCHANGSWSHAECIYNCGTNLTYVFPNTDVSDVGGTFGGNMANITCSYRPENNSDELFWVATCIHGQGWTFAGNQSVECPWELMFRGTAENGFNATDAFLYGNPSDGVTTNDSTCMNVHDSLCSMHYRSEKLEHWDMLNISMVSYDLYHEGDVVLRMVFNGTGLSMEDWFSEDHVISQPWMLAADNEWTVHGVNAGSRRGKTFSVHQVILGTVDCVFYTAVVYPPLPPQPCGFEVVHSSYPQFAYTTTGASLSTEDFQFASSMAIWMRQ